MRTDIFDYDLPRALIAQDPLPERDASRLLVLERATGRISHRVFRDLPELLAPGDCLALNTTRVFHGRLKGRKARTGGSVELLLLEDRGESVFKAMARGASLRPGIRVLLGDGTLEATVTDGLESGVVTVEFNKRGEELNRAIAEQGEMPLPPYITHELADAERYQTVYAEREMSAAAPTAGLHFTDALLERVRRAGLTIAGLELAVGMDTFVPVRARMVEDHSMHKEWFSLDEAAARAVNEARRKTGRVVAVGTTSVRALESCAAESRLVTPGEGCTDLFITPGYRFKIVDAIITNFHLPRTTLLMMVCAFGGIEPVQSAYEEAIREGYRFYSFGDAMLIQ
ncbi:MAG: tRNA preQ1(34) S-adenosylmethionine ribosyltransferase-isomerase QueA [Candidatus Anoxymicrobium japonicum]|uniref:S-adenosylmethionine:tRNA ribosyltransferase-isomerase n=1 Tax=Candidatus Anoxymicrobium japonicum TaxID=2013648 RepID=A0A2N3G828_9ACTN|nr:MAG: tRNA preQ1(34) S-adenosylmethionine ribosyltransferase-isomerase QueA [Candidatus Anoxymicrobium japonicum]